MNKGDLGFDFRSTKDACVLISWKGKSVVTLAGTKTARFIQQVDDLDEGGRQLLMARTTGNFKRGNERRAGRDTAEGKP